jgi:hypothetical protein
MTLRSAVGDRLLNGDVCYYTPRPAVYDRLRNGGVGYLDYGSRIGYVDFGGGNRYLNRVVLVIELRLS